MRTRLEIIQNEIFKDLPTLGRERFFACAWDKAGREVFIPCRDKNEALRKRELLQEMLELQEEAPMDFTA
jgi:hypothetical protein